MKIHLLAIGRAKEEADLTEDYLNRARGLGRTCGISAVNARDLPESRLATAALRSAAEASELESLLPPNAFRIVLDERGKAMTSAAFAGLFRKHLDSGTGDMAFLIGGPDGHGAALRDKAGLLLSLGPMTWPHRLVRLMLAEQIYRAVTILVNHPYHRP
ncbi:23S rRNA (pseudouridine(1915)-N(3))-methyltransferase RlmH [soil metagenome]